MKKFLFFVGLAFTFTNSLSSAATKYPSYPTASEILYACSESILDVSDEKIHLIIEKLCYAYDHFFVLSDAHNWLPLNNIYIDEAGYYIDMKEPQCPRGHTGIKRVGRTWYCMVDGCPYFIGDNF